MGYDIKLKKYFENIPYGENAAPSSVHGTHNHRTINEVVKRLFETSDEATKDGNNDLASKMNGAIKHIARQAETLQMLKEEYIQYMGGGALGKKLFSNWTDHRWEDEFFTENGTIDFDEDLNMRLDVPHLNIPHKKLEDVTEDWVVKGDEEQKYMQAQQLLVKERNDLGKPPSFDIDYFTDNILKTAWQSFLTDPIGGISFLQEYLNENIDQDGDMEVQLANLNLDKLSFNPENDTRLHTFFANRLKGSHKGSGPSENLDARLSRITSGDKSTSTAMRFDNRERNGIVRKQPPLL